MRQNSNLLTFALSLLLSFFTAVLSCTADECKKLDCSQQNPNNNASGFLPKLSTPVPKQTDVVSETKKEAGWTTDKNLSSTPAQVNQVVLESLERQKTGNLILPSNCISDKESEEIYRMGQTGTMRERFLQAGFSEQRYDRFVDAVTKTGLKDSPTPAR